MCAILDGTVLADFVIQKFLIFHNLYHSDCQDFLAPAQFTIFLWNSKCVFCVVGADVTIISLIFMANFI